MTVTVNNSNYLLLSACDLTSSGGTWSGGSSVSVETDFYKFTDGVAGTPACVAYTIKSVSTFDLTFTPSASVNLQNKVLRALMFSYQQFASEASNGIQFFMSDGSNTAYYTIMGGDTYPGGWVFLSLDCEATPTSGTKPTTTAITSLGFRVTTTSTSKNAPSFYIDHLHANDGLVVYGDDGGGDFDLDDIIALSNTTTTAYYILEKTDQGYRQNGQLTIGDGVGTNSTQFKQLSPKITCPDIWLPTDGFDVVVIGNATGTTDFEIGDGGAQGGFWTAEGASQASKPNFNLTDTNLDIMKLEGVTFVNCGTMDLPVTASGREVINCAFENCGVVTSSTCVMTGPKFINSPGAALELTSTSHNVTYAKFITCVTGVLVGTAGTYPMSGFDFADNGDGSSYFDVENEVNAVTTDSYIESNQDTDQTIGNGTINAGGQSFTGDGNVLSRARIWLKKSGTLSGTIVAKVYLATGSDPNQVPTGAELATSKTIPATDIGLTYAAHDFEFEDEFTLVNTTEYFISVEYTGDSGNYLIWGTDSSSPPSGSNFATYTTSWSAVNTDDGCFYIYTGAIVKMTLSNDSDPVYDLNSGTPPGATIMPISVNITFTIKRDDTKIVIQYVEVAVFKSSDDSELMNEQTDVSGIATQGFPYPGGSTNVYWRVREIPTADPQFEPQSSDDEITSDGLIRTIYLKNAPYVDDVST